MRPTSPAAVLLPLLAGLLLVPVPSPAQEPPSPAGEEGGGPAIGRIPGMVDAVPKNRRPPRFPPVLEDQGREGWVLLSLTVKVDGSVADIRVVDASDADLSFDEAAVRAIREWTYEPATIQGVPVEQTNRLQMITFSLSGQRGARDGVIRKLKQFDRAMDQRDVARMESILADLRSSGMNLYEFGHYFLREGNLFALTDRPEEAHRAYVRGLRSGGTDKSAERVLRRNILRMELILGQYRHAVETYEKLVAMGGVPADDPIMQAAGKLKLDLEGPPQLLRTTGRLVLDCRKQSLCGADQYYWVYGMARRTIHFIEATGDVQEVEARCDTISAKAELKLGTSWNVPESWGACTLWVKGGKGATITVVEE